MGKQSKGGGGNILLLAGLGVGAFMLFANKGSTQSRQAGSQPSGDAGEGVDADIPAAPRILAVNNSSSESPLPTGIVSDEEGMESTASTSTPSGTQSRTAPTPASEPDEDNEPTPTGTSAAPIPPLISTTLTPREKQIINQGQLTNDLAIQRPDLFRAIYIRKHGGNGKSQQALQAADAQIARIQAGRMTTVTPTQKKRRKVSLRLHPKTKTMVKNAQALNTRKVPPGVNAGKRVVAMRTPAGTPTGKPVTRPAHSQKKTARPKPNRKPAAPPRKPAVRKRR